MAHPKDGNQASIPTCAWYNDQCIWILSRVHSLNDCYCCGSPIISSVYAIDTDITGMHSTLGQVWCLLNCVLVKME